MSLVFCVTPALEHFPPAEIAFATPLTDIEPTTITTANLKTFFKITTQICFK